MIVSMSNIYVFFLQYLYAPTQEGLSEMKNITELKKMEMNDRYHDEERDMGVVDYSGKYNKNDYRFRNDDNQLVPDK